MSIQVHPRYDPNAFFGDGTQRQRQWIQKVCNNVHWMGGRSTAGDPGIPMGELGEMWHAGWEGTVCHLSKYDVSKDWIHCPIDLMLFTKWIKIKDERKIINKLIISTENCIDHKGHIVCDAILTYTNYGFDGFVPVYKQADLKINTWIEEKDKDKDPKDWAYFIRNAPGQLLGSHYIWR